MAYYIHNLVIFIVLLIHITSANETITKDSMPLLREPSKSHRERILDNISLMKINAKKTISLPLTYGNLISLIIIFALSLLGTIKMYQMCLTPKCNCPLCKGEYIIQDYISQGGFGAIYKVFSKKANKVVALKLIKVDDIDAANYAQLEAKRLRECHNDYVIPYYDDFLHEDMQYAYPLLSSLYVCIAMKLCNEDLEEYANSLSESIEECDIYRYIYELTTALDYCHKRNIIHRDIKPSNIFLSNSHILLGDFGLSTEINHSYTVVSDVGTSVYKAPETFLGGEYDPKKSDIFSMGLSLLQVISEFNIELDSEGGVPGALFLQNPSYLNNLLAYIPSYYSPCVKSIFAHLLDPNPLRRYSTTEILRDPCIQPQYWKSMKTRIVDL